MSSRLSHYSLFMFQSNMKKYESEHPGFVPPTIKTLITKNDRHVLEKWVIPTQLFNINVSEIPSWCTSFFNTRYFSYKGKPKKPPCNAYSLYSVIMLQSEALRDIPSKEKMAEIARRWKSLDHSEKEDYANRLQKVINFFF